MKNRSCRPMTEDIFPFDEIALWHVPPAGDGAGQMALDETMLRLAPGPVLRIYRWAAPAVTFGYPQRWADVRAFAGSRPCTRRCTGGGFVEHGDDITVTLAVPKSHPFSRTAPAEIYRWIHGAIRNALDADHLRLAEAGDLASGPACFSSPAPSDILAGDRKVAGGALRRSRDGFLYQGSLQSLPTPAGFEQRLGAAMAHEISAWQPTPEWKTLSAELAQSRYGATTWNQRR